MLRSNRVIAGVLMTLAASVSAGEVKAADVENKAVKAKPIADVPFFFINDNRLTYAYQFTATSPGNTSETGKQVYAFTHFDAWAYGTNFISLSLLKSDRNDPAGPCPIFGSNCAGAAEFYGFIRSTLGFNEVFNTKAFSVGALRNVSLQLGLDGQTENNFLAPNKRQITGGLQFAFDLPYKGFFNVAPLYSQEWNHNSFLTPAFVPAGFAGIPNGNRQFKPTWAVEVNYYMDLGFLPENLQYFAISGRAGFYGPKGTGAGPGIVPASNETRTEINSEPIRLTFDASKAVLGSKYSHFVDLWVAYRYWHNKFGLDDSNRANGVCFRAGINNQTCTEQSVYSGVSVKF